MLIYLSPTNDTQHCMDVERLGGTAKVKVVLLSFGQKATVQDVVHLLSSPTCTGLVVPDDYGRHNELIEHVKFCAHHMGQPVQPITRYMAQQHPPTPAKTSVHASTTSAGVGSGLPAGVG